MTDPKSLYLSFLLRLWLVDEGGEPIWRASLQCPLTGERENFANLDELITHLEQITYVAARETRDTPQGSQK